MPIAFCAQNPCHRCDHLPPIRSDTFQKTARLAKCVRTDIHINVTLRPVMDVSRQTAFRDALALTQIVAISGIYDNTRTPLRLSGEFHVRERPGDANLLFAGSSRSLAMIAALPSRWAVIWMTLTNGGTSPTRGAVARTASSARCIAFQSKREGKS